MIGLPITMAVVFMVLYFLWYFLRCCGLCGGRKASTACIGCSTYYDPNDKGDSPYTGAGLEEDVGAAKGPSYTADGKGCPCGCQTFLFRVWFLLFFLLVTAALAIGFVANGEVDTGLDNTVSILFYNVQSMAYDVSKMLDKLNTVMSGSGLGLDEDAIAGQQEELNCLSQSLSDFEADIQEGKDLGLEVRGYYVLAMLVIPFLVGVFYVVSAWCKWKCCVGFSSFLAWLLLIFVCISAAIHSLLALLLADVCYEFDLHLASYHLNTSDLYGTHENLAWLPEQAQGFCGTNGSLAFLEKEFEDQFDVAIQQGLDEIAGVCNDPDMQGFMDCTGVGILDGSAGPPPTYAGKTVACPEGQSASCGASYYNDMLGEVPDELLITDVNLNAVQVTSLADLPPQVLNCLADPISKVDGSWPSTGWTGIDVCMDSGAPTDATSAAACTGIWLKLSLVTGNEACTENGVPVAGSCENDVTGFPTGATTQAACGAGHTWTPLDLTGTTTMATVTAHAEACIEAATKVYLGREYGPLFDDADCTTTGDPTSCARPAAAVEEDYYTFPFDDSEQLALESWATTEPDADTVKNCYIEINADDPCEEATCLPPFFPRKTFRECATSCAETEARENARTAVQAIDDATDLFTDIHTIFDEEARPKLQCKFVSDVLADIFVPLCQESYGGIFLITAANYMGAVGLIISIPLGIMATKRFDKRWSEEEEETTGKTYQM